MKAEITFENEIATSNKAISGTSVEIILGDIYQGKTGKTAYEYAKEGGFKGTEKQYAQIMASPMKFEVTGTIN